MSYEYEYPRPMVTVDILLLNIYRNVLRILLIRRKQQPYAGQWALPGGFVEMNEDLQAAASRELHEETGLKAFYLVPLLTADDPSRDPRGRTISHLFGTLIFQPLSDLKAGDDASTAEWFTLENLPPLAFDHEQLIGRGVEEFKFQLFFKLSLFAFMKEKFFGRELEEYGDVLFQKKNLSTLLLHHALRCNLIKKIEDDYYQRTKRDSGLYPLRFSALTDFWLNQ